MRVQQITSTIVLGVLFASTVIAQEKKIKRSDLPPAVEKTVAEQSAGATIKGFNEEKEKGKTVYEAEMIVSGHTKDIAIDATGDVIEVEEEIKVASLPPAVRRALKAKAKLGKILKVESITKHGKLVAYEAQISTNGKNSEVQVGPQGEALDHEE